MDDVQMIIVDRTPATYYSASAHNVMLSKEEGKMSNDQTAMDDKTLYITIKTQLEKIDAEMAAQNWETANKLIKQALVELGDRYTRSDTIDDSGMKLIAADNQEKGGSPDNAAHVRRRILAERLEMLKSKIK